MLTLWHLAVLPQIIITTIILLFSIDCIHIVREGYVGVYSNGGKVLSEIYEPGIHFMTPFINRFYEVQISVQSDFVENIACGTSSGLVLYFDKIQVVNRLKREYALEIVKNYTLNYEKILIYDRIHHEINQFCTKHTVEEVFIEKFDTLHDVLKTLLQEQTYPYIESSILSNQWVVIQVIMSKPKLPKQIFEKYELTEVEGLSLKVAQQLAHVEEKCKMWIFPLLLIAILRAEISTNISEITRSRELVIAKGNQKISEIQMSSDQIMQNQRKTKALLDDRRQREQTEINRVKLSKEFIKNAAIELVATSEINFYGNSYEQFYSENQQIIDIL